MAATAAALHGWPGAFARLAYDRQAVGAGQWYRLISCHLMHSSSRHLFWNAVALVALGAAVEPRLGRRFPALLAVTALMLGALVHLCPPWPDVYCGLSGLVCVVFGFALLSMARQARAERDGRRLAALAAVGVVFAAKLGFETLTGRSLFSGNDDGFVVLPLAHLGGFLLGLASAAILACRH